MPATMPSPYVNYIHVARAFGVTFANAVIPMTTTVREAMIEDMCRSVVLARESSREIRIDYHTGLAEVSRSSRDFVSCGRPACRVQHTH